MAQKQVVQLGDGDRLRVSLYDQTQDPKEIAFFRTPTSAVEGGVDWHSKTQSAKRALDTLLLESLRIGSPRGLCRSTAATGCQTLIAEVLATKWPHRLDNARPAECFAASVAFNPNSRFIVHDCYPAPHSGSSKPNS